jgi:hypothetical protein
MLSPLYGQLSPLRIPTKVAGRQLSDADAITYIAAVESADAQTLEDGVKFAYEDFILGCKSDGIWSAIKASCILAGARTLSGALVPLVGTAPTNFNFVSGDYNRETGLKGNGSTKYLNSNRANNADPQNSKHIFSHLTEKFARSGNQSTIGISGAGGSGVIQAPAGTTYFQANSGLVFYSGNGSPYPLGSWGVSRGSSTEIDFIFKNDGSGYVSVNETGTLAINSLAPIATNIRVFRTYNSVYSTACLSFYSIGEDIDLPALDTRVSTLMTDLAAAI